uniref:Carbonyl reductase 1 n=1 Tax=Chelydra serpentina TaxID=8475 RepID=A0A8C3T9C6_CHESE
MSSSTPVAVVTGFTGGVYLTARDPGRVRLQEKGLSPLFHQLDITDLQRLNVLVNNTGFWFKGRTLYWSPNLMARDGFASTSDASTPFLSLMRTQCRVVNVSSFISVRALIRCSHDLQQKFRSDTITEEELVKFMTKFVEDTKNRVHEKEGWPNTAYGVSKVGVMVLSRIQARMLNEERKVDQILLNACCPGWVRTDMAGPKATKSPDKGAETPVYLALLAPDADGPPGQFVSEKAVQTW